MGNKDITEIDLQTLVRYFQEDRGGLAVDGVWGPKTSAALAEYRRENVVTQATSMGSCPLAIAYQSALQDVGKGGDPGSNNASDFLDAIRVEAGLPQLGGGEWCASFLSAHFVRAGLPVRSRSARGLGRALRDYPGGREVELGSETFQVLYALRVSKRGKNLHHVQLCRLYYSWGELRWDYVAGNERGDKVRHKTDLPGEDFTRGLVMAVTLGDECRR